ncbi:MAG: hypothetical protein ACFB21_08830 [Opitutales bacterium]
MPKTPLRKLLLSSPTTTLLLIAPLLFAACGGGDAEDGDGASVAGRAAAAPRPEPPPVPGDWQYDPVRMEYFQIEDTVGLGFDVTMMNDKIVIVGMYREGPAFAAGMPPGGVIKAFNGEPVASARELAQKFVETDSYTFTVHGPEGVEDYTLEPGPYQQRVYYSPTSPGAPAQTPATPETAE